MNYPDKPIPAGTRVVPEVAAAYPAVSRDGTTYTFTIRRGFRFNTGEQVTARSFARAIDRMLSPAMKSAWSIYVQDVVGAQAVLAGKATEPTGVTVRGSRLTIRLTRPARDFPARTTFFGFCAVPEDLPITPEGVTTLPGAGPYYVAKFVSGQTLVLRRNPFYHGPRPHRARELRFVDTPDPVRAVQAGRADYAELAGNADVVNLAARYRAQVHAVPGIGVRYVVLNSSQPLFRNNVRLRQAVNFALDRRALLEARGGPITGSLTDQYLSPAMPGFVDAHIYPLHHPNVRKARALAKGHTRGGRAMLYVKDDPIDIAQAEIIRRDLARIGIAVNVRKLPGPALFQQLFTPGAPYDLTVLGFGPDYWDPFAILNVLFDGRLSGTAYSFDVGHFGDPTYDARLARASRLAGATRYAAYGRLDVDLARNAAPMVAYESESNVTFVSRRTRCIVLNPSLDLAAVCLR